MSTCSATQNLHYSNVTSKRRKWLFLIVGSVAFVALIALLTRESEPSYLGKSLSHWVALYANEEWGRKAADHQGVSAFEAIQHIGTNGLPCLIRWIQYEGPLDAEVKQAQNATLAFVPLGRDARTVIPDLMQILINTTSSNTETRAAYALTCIGKQAIPAIVAQLANTNPVARARVVLLLGRVAGSDATLIQLLKNRYEDRDEAVRIAATNASGADSR